MRVRPLIMLIAAGTATAVLSTACESDGDTSGPSPLAPMFTTIDGVVRSADSVWVDSIPVPGVVVTTVEAFHGRDDGRTIFAFPAQTTTGPNGEYHMEFTAHCRERSSYFLTVNPPYFLRPLDGIGNRGSLPGACTVPNIRFDIWVLHR